MTELRYVVAPRVAFYEGAERIPILEVIERSLYDDTRKVYLLEGVECDWVFDYLRNRYAKDPRIHVSSSPRFLLNSGDLKYNDACRIWIHADPKIQSKHKLAIAPTAIAC